VIVKTEWPLLAPAIKRAGFVPVIVCPCCRGPATLVEGVLTAGYVCESCTLAWASDADIDSVKEMLRRAGKL
jgi:hypothetical protein